MCCLLVFMKGTCSLDEGEKFRISPTPSCAAARVLNSNQFTLLQKQLFYSRSLRGIWQRHNDSRYIKSLALCLVEGECSTLKAVCRLPFYWCWLYQTLKPAVTPLQDTATLLGLWWSMAA